LIVTASDDRGPSKVPDCGSKYHNPYRPRSCNVIYICLVGDSLRSYRHQRDTDNSVDSVYQRFREVRTSRKPQSAYLGDLIPTD
ncbi:hypothetical protein KCU95_g53, partial [Aureobasidium melanogenum]